MSLRDQIPELIEYINSKEDLLHFNKKLFDILEGELKKYVEQSLEGQLSDQTYSQIKHRIAPINVLQRIVDKLSRIYQQNPSRVVVSDEEKEAKSDSELLAWYEKNFRINFKMNAANEFFNGFRNCLVQPYVFEGKPKLRSIPNDRFLVYSSNKIEPTEPTHVILIQGSKQIPIIGENGKDTGQFEDVTIYHVYTDEEFLIFNSKGDVETADMIAIENEEGVNPFGKIPFVYINKSNNLLIPKPDQDGLQMGIVIPVLLSDLNGAVMFQSFSIIYGIDVDDKDIKFSPNAFWSFKTGGDGEKRPEVNTIKPEVDIDQVLGLIKSEFVFWLETKGIKAGNVGNVNGENFASGIAKIMDEMDTAEDRQKQTKVFGDAEERLWNLISENMHPYWVTTNQIDNKTLFSADFRVLTNYAPQIPMHSRGKAVEDVQKEIVAGLTTRELGLKTLNPHLNDKQIEELMEEIEKERTVVIEEPENASEMAEDKN
jgi:hypothetical protein